MNVTELARKLKISTKELLELLPAMGFDIGKRAIKVDDRTAQKIINNWPKFLAKEKIVKKEEKEIKEEEKEKKKLEKKIVISSLIRVRDLATKFNLPVSVILSELMKNGVLASMNEQIDYETAAIIGHDLGFEVELDKQTKGGERKSIMGKRIKELLKEKDKSKLKPRPPIVVVLGHVDHGKTKLLDTIRKTNIIETESGGITQHIGAYQVSVPLKKEPSSQSASGRRGVPRSTQDDLVSRRIITFIDTPGHEAFSVMRSRGAKVADIAILVVAADDGVQPQTKESIKIIKSARLPMIIAINKIDRPEANPEKVKQELARLGLVPEEWGGKTICVPISAKMDQGIEQLLETILLVADLEAENIKANPEREAVGTIIESRLDKGEGPVATVLIQNGTLEIGDFILINDNYYGKVRAMKDFLGKAVKIATLSMPVKILGLKAVPSVGDILQATKKLEKRPKVTKAQLSKDTISHFIPLVAEKKEAEGTKEAIKTLNLILKTDVLGSLEAITGSLEKFSHPEVKIKTVSKGLGNIAEGDVLFAENTQALIVGFRVKMTPSAEVLAQEKKIQVKIFNVIYHLLEEIKRQLEKLLEPEVIRTELGIVKVLEIFLKRKKEMIIGGKVTKGKIQPKTKIRVLRDNQVITEGILDQLQINKIDVTEVKEGQECGIKYEGKPLMEVGDILEVYQEKIKEKKINF